MKSYNNSNQATTYLFGRYSRKNGRPEYDLTDVIEAMNTQDADYIYAMALLSGMSMVSVERGALFVDDNGDDFGDNLYLDYDC